MNKFILVFLVILPRDTLQIYRFKYSLIRQLVYTPDKSIEINPQIIHYFMSSLRSISEAKIAETLVSGEHSITKVFFSDFL
jgi:hypothetical protein